MFIKKFDEFVNEDVQSAAKDPNALRTALMDLLTKSKDKITNGNVCIVKDGKLASPSRNALPGITRKTVFELADQMGIDRPVAIEPVYNMVDRTAEVELLPAAANYGIGAVPYSPLARGVLTGKYARDGAPPADSRAGRGDRRIQQTEWRQESLAIAQKLAAYAAERGTTPIAFAIAWVLKNDIVSSAIAGPRTEAHWDSYVEALTLRLGPDDEKFVDSLVPPGHASTPGYTDPNYPVEGRRVTA